MIAIDNNEVEIRGEPPAEVLWQGKQWAVTDAGIEARDGTYFIAASRLEEDLPDWSWLEQMRDKTWVDVPDFATAYLVAIALHGYSRIDAALLRDKLVKVTRKRHGK